MQLQVTDIEFDFTGAEDEISVEDMSAITEEMVGQTVEAFDEEDLVEEITSWTGWCIKSINYRHVLT